MALQDDLTAERAAKQYTMNDLFKLAMEGKVNIVEDRFVSAAALKTARQAALRECLEIARADGNIIAVREQLYRLASEGAVDASQAK